ncbi:putative dithiol-disulfide oxidoreductase (DUF899 family) [Sphingobium sp. OAS761]|nr:putative dithiol-disulfide oxidoreductase (DUF899 family) [Sphingobium sp. OAS761]
MTDEFPHMSFPNESQEYREARNALLDAEIALRRQAESVARIRRDCHPVERSRRILSSNGSAPINGRNKCICRNCLTISRPC